MLKLTYDEKADIVTVEENGVVETFPLASPDAFKVLSNAWLRVGWYTKHIYSFTWLGRPIIQLPEDMVRFQEVLWQHQPDVLIETGVAHGGSLIFYASIFKAMGRGRVIGVELALRDVNRQAIESHPLGGMITLVDGSSTAPASIETVKSLIQPGEKVMVMLDSDHSKSHVLDELRAYADVVSPGSYIVASDGIMALVAGGPRTRPEWAVDNPTQAAAAFVAENPAFVLEEPQWLFNEGVITERVTHWPGAFVKRIR